MTCLTCEKINNREAPISLSVNWRTPIFSLLLPQGDKTPINEEQSMMRQPNLLFVALCVISLTIPSVLANSQCAGSSWYPQWEDKQENANGGFQLCTDKFGNVYTIGTDEDVSPSGMLLVKWDRDGNKLWKRSFVPPGASQCSGVALELDKSRNIVVAGLSWYSGQEENEATVASWTEGGIVRWYSGFSKEGFGQINPRDIAVDRKGNSYVTGSINPSGAAPENDIFVIKVSKTGTLIWNQTYNGPDDDQDFAEVIEVDRSGNCFIGGFTKMDAGFRDMLVAK